MKFPPEDRKTLNAALARDAAAFIIAIIDGYAHPYEGADKVVAEQTVAYFKSGLNVEKGIAGLLENAPGHTLKTIQDLRRARMIPEMFVRLSMGYVDRLVAECEPYIKSHQDLVSCAIEQMTQHLRSLGIYLLTAGKIVKNHPTHEAPTVITRAHALRTLPVTSLLDLPAQLS